MFCYYVRADIAGSGRPAHQQIVAAGSSDFEAALGGLLSTDVAEVDSELLRGIEQCVGVDFQRRNSFTGVQHMHDVHQRPNGINGHAIDDCSLAGIDLGQDQLADFIGSRGDGDGARPAN